MSPQPLAPFHPPAGLGVHVAVSPGMLGLWIFAAALLFWAIYTLIAIYHWIKFSHAAAVAYPAITLHLVVSAAIVLYALSGVAGLV